MKFLKKYINEVLKIIVLLISFGAVFWISKTKIEGKELWLYERKSILLLISFVYLFFCFSTFFGVKKNSGVVGMILGVIVPLTIGIGISYLPEEKIYLFPILLPIVWILMESDITTAYLYQIFILVFYYFSGFVSLELSLFIIVYFGVAFFLQNRVKNKGIFGYMLFMSLAAYLILAINYSYFVCEKVIWKKVLLGIIPVFVSIIPLYFKNILIYLNKKYLETKLFDICDEENELLLSLMDVDENAYFHSLRVADVSIRVAKYMNANVQLVNAGARFHEIGKVGKGNYIAIGIGIMKKAGFPLEVIKIVREHNSKSNKPKTIESAIVMLTDSIETTLSQLVDKRGGNINKKKIVESVINIRFDTGMLDYAITDIGQFKKLRKIYLEIYR